MRRLYLFLAVAGLILPYYFSVSFLVKNGVNLPLLLGQLFANDISTCFAVDLIVSAVVFIVFVTREAPRYRMANRWVYLVATVLIGPSLALPLFLYLREGQIEAMTSVTSSPPQVASR